MSYWSNIDPEPEANLTGDFIREAIRELENKTSGRIKGSFSKVEYAQQNYQSTIVALAKLFPAQSVLTSLPLENKRDKEKASNLVELPDDDLQDRHDINFDYKPEIYKFEIYNQAYRFRILRLINFSYTFPVGVVLDEGVGRELELIQSSREINSNSEMTDFLEKILKTQKVRNVVNQLLLLDKIQKGNDILVFLEEHPKSTLSDIASGLKWPKQMVKDSLDLLIADNKIEEVFTGDKARKWIVKNETL